MQTARNECSIFFKQLTKAKITWSKGNDIQFYNRNCFQDILFVLFFPQHCCWFYPSIHHLSGSRSLFSVHILKVWQKEDLKLYPSFYSWQLSSDRPKSRQEKVYFWTLQSYILTHHFNMKQPYSTSQWENPQRNEKFLDAFKPCSWFIL